MNVSPSYSPTRNAPSPAPQAVGDAQPQRGEVAIEVKDLDFYYGAKKALDDITIDIPRHKATAFIGPSGCGKSTLLRCFNRMNDKIDNAVIKRGHIHVEGQNVHARDMDPVRLRREVGMVFQKSNPFPRSIYENVAYGLRIVGENRKALLDEVVEESLRGAALWEEVKDRLQDSAFGLSGGQQQRLCIARAIAVKPKVLLMDEPCSALDPVATVKVEELIHQIKDRFTVVIVTHNMQQATRVSDNTALFYLGKLVEYAPTQEIFHNPRQELTERYVTGRFS